MIRRTLTTLIALALTAASFYAQSLESLPHYQPRQSVSGTIRIWGHGSPKRNFMGKLMGYWEDGFGKYNPDVRFENKMYGTASAIGDDRLQRQAQGRVVPDSFTHGSSAQRARWFRIGLDSGDPRKCDTFRAQQL